MLVLQDVSPTTYSPHLQEGDCTDAIKFAVTPNLVAPAAGAPAKTYTLTLRLPAAGAGTCLDLRTLCGGGTCLTGVADADYDYCPSYVVGIAP